MAALTCGQSRYSSLQHLDLLQEAVEFLAATTLGEAWGLGWRGRLHCVIERSGANRRHAVLIGLAVFASTATTSYSSLTLRWEPHSWVVLLLL